jgi:ABC-2 type transport system permease protein
MKTTADHPTILAAYLKYGRIWRQLAWMSFLTQTGHPISSTGYLLGKLVRVGFFLFFLKAIFQHTQSLVGYSLEEVVLFFLTFNLIDILAQLIFRGVYGVRALIREGDLDYFLIQPTNVLFRMCFSSVDFLDVVTTVPIVAVIAWLFPQLGPVSALHVFLYVTLIINGLFISFAVHVAVASVAVWTQELDNTIWIYRDLMSLGRFPVDIYVPWVRHLLTFMIPVAVMISFPVKAYLRQLTFSQYGVALLVTACFVGVSLWFWNCAKQRYTSVSS